MLEDSLDCGVGASLSMSRPVAEKLVYLFPRKEAQRDLLVARYGETRCDPQTGTLRPELERAAPRAKPAPRQLAASLAPIYAEYWLWENVNRGLPFDDIGKEASTGCKAPFRFPLKFAAIFAPRYYRRDATDVAPYTY